MQMSQEMKKTDESSEKEKVVQENRVLIWEQTSMPQKTAADKVVNLDAYRQMLKSGESEATVTSWELIPNPTEQPVKLIMISSGFGKSVQGTNSVQGLAA
jgi:hypothetical protein